MTMNYFVRVVLKGRDISVSIDEAHKVYYLFSHPDERGILQDGTALIGSEIRGIFPDYNATMGWNPTHRLNDDDWVEINRSGAETALRLILERAKEFSKTCTALELNKPLFEALKIDMNKALPTKP
jgi:hypothetical protein